MNADTRAQGAEAVMRRIRQSARTHLCVLCGKPCRRWPSGAWSTTCGDACMNAWVLGRKRSDHFAHLHEGDDDAP